MVDEQRLYSITEANELLPYLAPALMDLRDRFADVVEIRSQIAAMAASNGGQHNREDWTKSLARVTELLERLRQWAVILRDVDTGLVDFPAVVDGQEAYLCWKLGEETVAHWHLRTEGMSSRKRL
jgi:hypothetical protein